MNKGFEGYDSDSRFIWSDGGGSIELELTAYEAAHCSMPGDCAQAVKEEMRFNPTLRARLDKIDPESLAECLSEYTDWDVSDHEENLERVLWIASGDIQDRPEEYHKESE